MNNFKSLLIFKGLLILVFFFFQSCKQEQILEPIQKKPVPTIQKNNGNENNYNIRLRPVIKNRIPLFIKHLNSKGLAIKDAPDLLKKLGPVEFRKQIADQFNLDFICLQVHLELADLMELGLSDIDAQILHFSRWNYQNPFTGEIINRKVLADSDPEDLMIDMAGWAAGSMSPIVQDHEIGIPEIQNWIDAAQQADASLIEYTDYDPSRFEFKLSCNCEE